LPSRITLLTDFGSADGYVAAMRGVIASHCPSAIVDDAGHDIAPGDVHAAAHALSRYWLLYPPGTVHIVVVDPGVGGERRAIVVRTHSRVGVGPDNGVLESMLQEGAEVREITNSALVRAAPSATFHGRDVFAPVAAFLACGGAIASAGQPAHEPARLPASPPVHTPDRVLGHVIHIDRFGNVITDLPGDAAMQNDEIWLSDRRIGSLRRTYSDVATGEILALVGSNGMIEICVRDGNAARALGITRQTIATLSRAHGTRSPGVELFPEQPSHPHGE
jgi:hypothetical protein